MSLRFEKNRMGQKRKEGSIYIVQDPIYATVSKFSIVDLAGSERYRNTLNFGNDDNNNKKKQVV